MPAYEGIQPSRYEGSQQGITWSSISEGEFSLAASLGMLAFDVVFYLLIAWYASTRPRPPSTPPDAPVPRPPRARPHAPTHPHSAVVPVVAPNLSLLSVTRRYLDQVVPSEYGLQRKPWFVCLPSYWCSKDEAAGSDQMLLQPDELDEGEAPLVVPPTSRPAINERCIRNK